VNFGSIFAVLESNIRKVFSISSPTKTCLKLKHGGGKYFTVQNGNFNSNSFGPSISRTSNTRSSFDDFTPDVPVPDAKEKEKAPTSSSSTDSQIQNSSSSTEEKDTIPKDTFQETPTNDSSSFGKDSYSESPPEGQGATRGFFSSFFSNSSDSSYSSSDSSYSSSDSSSDSSGDSD